MPKKHKCAECKQRTPIWMVTYGDMVTLLLTFFVLLFTVAKIDGRDIRLLLSPFRGSLGLFDGGQTLTEGSLESMGLTVESLPSKEKGSNLAKSIKEATEVFKPEIKSKQISVEQNERGTVISLIGDDHFEPGSAELNSSIQKALEKVGGLLRNMNAPVRVEGHADQNPVNSNKITFSSNWELASQRSINVIKFLTEEENVKPEKLSAVSYGRYRPLSKSKTPEGRATNRRIDIVILTHKNYNRDYNDIDLGTSKIPGVEWEF